MRERNLCRAAPAQARKPWGARENWWRWVITSNEALIKVGPLKKRLYCFFGGLSDLSISNLS